MRVVAVIQARIGSSRLPAKSLRPLAGRPLISHIAERVLAVRGIDECVLATSVNARDDALAAEAIGLGLHVYRGSEWDVLGRVAEAVDLLGDVVVRITGDCPLLCPETAARVIAEYRRRAVDYAWNDTMRSGYPDGTDVEVFHADLLHAAATNATDAADREHVTPWIRRHARAVWTLANDVDYSRYKLSVDTQRDYDFVRAVYGYLSPGQLTLDQTIRAVCAAEGAAATWT